MRQTKTSGVEDSDAQTALASWLCSRMGHDLVNPLAALRNGVELLEEEDDTGMRTEALQLVGAAAQRALSKLNFFRLAFGADSSPGTTTSREDVLEATEWMCEEFFQLHIDVWREEIPRNMLKLLLQMLLLARGCIPRGGRLCVAALEWENGRGIAVSAEGAGAKVPGDMPERLRESSALPEDIHGSLPAFTARLLASEGMRIDAENASDKVTLRAYKESAA
ncbi:MAG: histidine phosphotransferase family protein [Hyphomicrobiales bacterium]|nr:histidine phosphotransferase family protein [Hyphomicrobiales bacterium]